MNICSVIIQNKRGQNIFVVSANDYSHETSLQQSKDIYNYILSQLKAGKKIHRQIILDSKHACVCSVTKEAIFLVIIRRSDLFLGYEALRKLCEFFSKNMRLEITTKKYQEMLLLLDEFLYTKELMVQKLQYNLAKPIIMSSRNIADCDHLHKFINLQGEIEKNLIANIPLKYARKRQNVDRQNDIIMRFVKPVQINFECSLTHEEGQWLQNYKNFNQNCAFKLKSKRVQIENQQRRYQVQRQSLYNHKQPNQKSSVKPYVSISSSDTQILKSRFLQQQQQQKLSGYQDIYTSQAQNKFLGQSQAPKQINLLGSDEVYGQPQAVQTLQKSQQPQQQQQQVSSIQNSKQNLSSSGIKSAANSTHSTPQTFNDLIELDYTPTNHQLQVSQSVSLPPDLSFLSLSPLRPPEVKLKIQERMLILQKDKIIKEIKMFGQVCLEGDFQEEQANLQLIGSVWTDPSGCQRRITPNSIDLQPINDTTYRMNLKTQSFKSAKAIIDYILPNKGFKQEKVPLIFMYRLEQQQNFASFCLQFKVQETCKVQLFDIEIEVNLENDIEFEDLKTSPPANSINNKQIIWRSKQLNQKQTGKLVLNLTGIKRPNSALLQYIKITLKANTSIIEDMDCLMFYQVQEHTSIKRLAVEYKILPNS